MYWRIVLLMHRDRCFDPCSHCVYRNKPTRVTTEYQLDNMIYTKLRKLYDKQREDLAREAQEYEKE